MLAWILAENEVPFALPAVGLPLLLFADAFFWRFFMVRPQLLSMTLLLLGLHLAGRRRLRAPPRPRRPLHPRLRGPRGAPGGGHPGHGRWIAGAKLLAAPVAVRARPQPILVTAVGLGVGVAVHPNAANELHPPRVSTSASALPRSSRPSHAPCDPVSTWRTSRPVAGLSTGMEFRPPRIMVSVLLYPAWGTGLVLLAFFGLGRVRPRRSTVQALVVSLAWTASFFSQLAVRRVPGSVLGPHPGAGPRRFAPGPVHRRLAAWPPLRRRALVVVLARSLGWSSGFAATHGSPPRFSTEWARRPTGPAPCGCAATSPTAPRSSSRRGRRRRSSSTTTCASATWSTSTRATWSTPPRTA